MRPISDVGGKSDREHIYTASIKKHETQRRKAANLMSSGSIIPVLSQPFLLLRHATVLSL